MALLATATAVVGLLGACANADPNRADAQKPAASFSRAPQDENSEITVWVDATRVAAVDAYKKAHPNVKVKAVTFGGGSGNELQTKVTLFDRTGEGWPDVVWPGNQDLSWATSGKTPFAAPISELVDKSFLDGYAKGSLDQCTINGKVYCVRHDLAPNVLWYNKRLMDQFGYTVPATWEEWRDLGLKVSKEHPGYLVGEVGSPGTPDVYFWGSQCPASVLTGPRAVNVDLQDAKCTRVATMLDSLLAANVLGTRNKYDTGFIKDQASKILLMPGPAWYGQTLFNTTYKTPAGEIAVAAPLKWAGDAEAHTGAVGGGMWFVSSHSKNLKASVDFVKWVTTDPDYTAGTGTFPAYTAAADAWLAKQQASGYFANDIGPVFKDAAPKIWTGWAVSTTYSQEAIYASTMVPAITQGKTITSQLGPWQDAIVNQAKSLGYSVN
ncbi:ABC transporter substrate-binding protein [Dactylosporangium sp. McL0621]|uniref:ABC transporter substrate-binding protein n=1 Tax=Dactylosporangium sp. McL0621 TaxID=3415678 RepID=UPI003CF4A982